VDHCIVGKILAEKWNLSEDLITVMRYHHSPLCEEGSTELNQTVYLANVICKNSGIGLVLDKTPLEAEPEVFTKLGVTKDIEDEVLSELQGEIDKAMEFLKV
ncbi:MAG: hypothetical protein HQK83_20385, partial [Fibrobacteria bacterium]|nr:hypothetical protein [Fibrobacteria bacterium]